MAVVVFFFDCDFLRKELVEKSQIVRLENGKFESQLKRNDPRTNPHSPFVSCHWRANTDFQPIISLDSVVRYIAKYAAKSESVSDGLADIQNTLNSVQTYNRSTTSIVQQILIKQCGERDYSAQEYIWVALGFQFYSTSRSFVVLNLHPNAFIPVNMNEAPNSSIIRDVETTYANRLIDF